MRVLPFLLALAGVAAAQGFPNLVLDTDLLGRTTSFDVVPVPDDACELKPIDHCVGAAGARKVLRFSVQAVNEGTADLVVGAPPVVEPPNGGQFIYSDCHMHYHFDTFARYELRERGTDTVVAPGQKRAFCIEDTVRVAPDAGATSKYCCNPTTCGGVQGVQVGWADLYPSNLACQWIDVTDVPAGDYDLCVLLNTAGLLAEDPAGNSGCVPVTVGAPTETPPRAKVRAPHRGKKARVGRPLHVAWKRRARGQLLFQDVWLSLDGGATYRSVGHVSPPKKTSALRFTPTADEATDAARVRVYVCVRNPADDPSAGALQCAQADSGTFRILP